MTRSPPGRGLVIAASATARSREAARSNRRASLISVRVTSQWCAQVKSKRLLTKLPARTPWPLLVANMVEDHHEGVLHAAYGR